MTIVVTLLGAAAVTASTSSGSELGTWKTGVPAALASPSHCGTVTGPPRPGLGPAGRSAAAVTGIVRSDPI
eukprot:765549-Hanusia_phi.AAC.10